MELERVIHDFQPIYNSKSRILMLGTMPSPKSREAEDSSIRNPIPNDMKLILEHSDVQAVFTTGTKAAQLYKRYCYPQTGIEAVCLPSTSPANCRMSYEELYEAYAVIKKYL